jgi:ABC-type Fe3+-hydroxamate transport system, periplasmic component
MRNTVFNAFLSLLFVLAVWGHNALGRLSGPAAVPADPERIVSLAPSVTETLYALGMGTKVVGVTQFCVYPPDVVSKPKVAGFSEINFEAILRVRPDLVVLPNDKTENKKDLERLGLPVFDLDTRSLPDLMRAVKTLGEKTGHRREAETILAQFRTALGDARKRAEGKNKPRVLFSVMHTYEGFGYITEINAVGRDGFYNELIEAAGGVNVYRGTLPFPRLSREAIIFCNPDVIIDVVPGAENLEAVRRDWESLSSVNAIRDNRLYLLTDEADTIPGPRSYQTLTRLSQAFFPSEAGNRERREQ